MRAAVALTVLVLGLSGSQAYAGRHHHAHHAQCGGRGPTGLASYYGQGQRTASGERFDPRALTAASCTLPFGSMVRVTNRSTGRSVVVRINDRGPYVPGRVIDVSRAAAARLGMLTSGVARVSVEPL